MLNKALFSICPVSISCGLCLMTCSESVFTFLLVLTQPALGLCFVLPFWKSRLELVVLQSFVCASVLCPRSSPVSTFQFCPYVHIPALLQSPCSCPALGPLLVPVLLVNNIPRSISGLVFVLSMLLCPTSNWWPIWGPQPWDVATGSLRLPTPVWPVPNQTQLQGSIILFIENFLMFKLKHLLYYWIFCRK